MLVEDNPNFEKIVFDITTDGQSNPMTIFKDAVATMYKQLEIFTSEFGIKAAAPTPKAKEDDEQLKQLLTKVEELNLSARSHNCLTRAGIRFVGEVALMSENELSKVKNLGKKSLDEIKAKMEEIGYPTENDLDGALASSLQSKINELKG